MDMAARLGVSQPTVAKMLKRLASVGLIEMILGAGCFSPLKAKTGAGEPRATPDRREFLLVLGVSPEIARRDAEGMEHHVSEETLVKFREFTLKYGPSAE